MYLVKSIELNKMEHSSLHSLLLYTVNIITKDQFTKAGFFLRKHSLYSGVNKRWTFLISDDRVFWYTEHCFAEFCRICDLYCILTVTPFKILLMFHIKDP